MAVVFDGKQHALYLDGELLDARRGRLGANVFAKNGKGRSAADLARTLNWTETAQQLEEHAKKVGPPRGQDTDF